MEPNSTRSFGGDFSSGRGSTRNKFVSEDDITNMNIDVHIVGRIIGAIFSFMSTPNNLLTSKK